MLNFKHVCKVISTLLLHLKTGIYGLVTCPQSSDPVDPLLLSVSQEVKGVFLSTFLVADLERKSSGVRYALYDQTVVTTTTSTTTTTTTTTGR